METREASRAEQGTWATMAGPGTRGAMLNQGNLCAEVDQGAWTAMADPGTQEAMAGPPPRPRPQPPPGLCGWSPTAPPPPPPPPQKNPWGEYTGSIQQSHCRNGTGGHSGGACTGGRSGGAGAGVLESAAAGCLDFAMDGGSGLRRIELLQRKGGRGGFGMG